MKETTGCPANADGGGGNFAQVRKIPRWEAALERQAVRCNWLVPEQCRKKIVDHQVDIACRSELPARESTASAMCIVNMCARNLTLKKQAYRESQAIQKHILKLKEGSACRDGKIPTRLSCANRDGFENAEAQWATR